MNTSQEHIAPEDLNRHDSIVHALEPYAFDGNDVGTDVCDLLTNLMLFCANQGINFSAELQRAERHFNEESK